MYGVPFSEHVCSHCVVGVRWLIINCGGYIGSDVRDELREHAEEYHHTPHAVPLLRLVAGMRRKWKRFDGKGMMEIPALPPPLHVREAA